MVFDAVDKYPRDKAKKAGNIYLNVDTNSNKCKMTQTVLVELKNIVEEGKLKIVVDREYRFEEIIEAHRYVDLGHKKGNVVVNVYNNQEK